MYIEIEYLFQEDKQSEQQLAWTYFHANTDDFAKAMKQAGTYFKSFVKSNGWTRKATLKSIQKMRSVNDEIPIVASSEPAPTPTKRKRTQRKTTPSRKKPSSRTTKSK